MLSFRDNIKKKKKKNGFTHVKHHGSHDVEVGEVDAQPPGQVEEDEQRAGQPLAEDPIGAAFGGQMVGHFPPCELLWSPAIPHQHPNNCLFFFFDRQSGQ
uniref:Uncharacterized protein n=1 Tax=Oryctolagus cuniculus TaxID=9986 RepID=A0A5F9DU80_RABIT